jgi:phosphohistidine phosphatase
MDLLIVRHAIAEERAVFSKTGKDDAERPLTREGRRKFRRGARGLRRVAPTIDVLASSRLARAVETAEILQKTYRMDGVVRLDELEPSTEPSALVPWLRGERRRDVVAVVGHEPHLSRLVEYLLTKSDRGFVDLKKGGACLLALGQAPQPGRAEMRWLLTASQLRSLDER